MSPQGKENILELIPLYMSLEDSVNCIDKCLLLKTCLVGNLHNHQLQLLNNILGDIECIFLLSMNTYQHYKYCTHYLHLRNPILQGNLSTLLLLQQSGIQVNIECNIVLRHQTKFHLDN